jgi:hypothetical protein
MLQAERHRGQQLNEWYAIASSLCLYPNEDKKEDEKITDRYSIDFFFS